MKSGDGILALFFFILIGLAGIALVGLGSWILLEPVQSRQQIETPVFLTPTLAISQETPIIITATSEPSQTPVPIDAPTAIAINTPTITLFPTFTRTPGSVLLWEACPGAFLSQLNVGSKAMVSLDPPLPNNVRAQADKTAKFLFSIQPGDVVQIIGGPGCSNSWVWWQIKTQDGRSGWTSEGDGKDYWLVPAN